jgi:UDP-N-acetylglucosamine--N-acetylmuramyl-(pentapeptide) pyrophosphoryl-undecaprenol N-acetylglucosamine transferase
LDSVKHSPARSPGGARAQTTELGALPLPPGSRYLVTGGGTGGHVYPAIAIADEIKRRDPTAQFLYVGVKGKSEASIVPRRGYPLRFVQSEGWPGGRQPVALLRFAIKLSLGILKSFYLLMVFRPRLIIGSGGYVSAPIMIAAILLRRLKLYSGKTFIHEQNTFPGKLNRLVGARVDRVGVSFAETLKYFPRTGTYVGYPVRRELGFAERDAARARLKIPAGKKVIFAFGGSQGARTINRAIVEALPFLKERDDLYIIHGTGAYRGPNYDAVGDTRARLQALELDSSPDFYMNQDYFHNIEDVYAVADLVVCRGGAGTLTEIAARGLPSLIIPKANLPGDHQVKNARALANVGAGRVIYERVELTEGGIEERVPGDFLAKALLELLDDPAQLAEMSRSAKAFYRSDSLGRIGDVLAGLLEPAHAQHTQEEVAEPVQTGPDFESLGPVALVSYLERRERRNEGPLTQSDLEYLQYRTDDYLASRRWEVRNRGVKLVGLLGYQERRPHLLFLLKERRPVSLPQRLLGGDYEQVGFIRRNVFEALRRLNVLDREVLDIIQLGLEDNYFEVRTQACLTVAHFADRLGDTAPQIASQLRHLLRDSSFEVIIAAARALGKVSTDGAIAEDFKQFLFNKNWKIRQAIVQSLGMLLERRVLRPSQVSAFLEEMLITSNGFQPMFPLKVELQNIGKILNRTPEEPVALTPSPEDDT